MKIITVDTETSIKNRGYGAVGDFKASPFHVDNKIVLVGYCFGEENAVTMCNEKLDCHFVTHDKPFTLVGQNIGFDLLYLYKSTALLSKLHLLHIWDIQQVAYLLSGHRHLYPSLNDLAAELGLPTKPDKIKAYWDAGVDTEMIPPAELMDYLKHDVLTTQAIYYHQLAFLQDHPDLLELVRVKMDDILCTVMMEWEGMEFDLDTAYKEIEELESQSKILELAMRGVAGIYGMPSGLFNLATPKTVSALLFGGELEKEEDVPVIDPETGVQAVYKTGARAGQGKTRKEKVSYAVDGIGLKPLVLKNKSGFYPVDDEHLQELVASSPGGGAASVINNILDWREINKDLGTYYKGYSSLVWPDGKIHASYNHCATRTGRQSCTKPNLQNVTKTDED